MDKITILIADDHEVIHSGIAGILNSDSKLEIIAHAYNGKDAVDKTLELRPDVVFMDISMPVMTGIEAVKEIVSAFPEARIIGLTQHDEIEYVLQFMKNGGLGFLLKNSKQWEFMTAIQAVMEGRKYLSYEISLAMSERATESEIGSEEKIHLTRREIEIVKKIAQEKNSYEIADELNISLRTVETHRRNISQKLNAKSVIGIIKYASQNGLIDL